MADAISVHITRSEKMATSKSKFQVVPASNVVKARRGRTAVYDGVFLDQLREVDPTILAEGAAILLTDDKWTVDPTLEGDALTKAKNGIAPNIRKHWERAFDRACRIDWTPEGQPQVRHKD